MPELLRTPAIQRWWPTTQSLDLVEGGARDVSLAVIAEVARFIQDLGERPEVSWSKFASIEAAFQRVPHFANVPTHILVLPTHSRWTVLWNNSFLCDGYDSLCWNLTRNHQLTTLHWSAHDTTTSFQPGAAFTFRKMAGDGMLERSVWVAQEDKKWKFGQAGPALPEEDLAAYEARTKRHRLNEQRLAKLLLRLGARPWDEAFYDLASQEICCITRTSPPPTITVRSRDAVLSSSD